MYILNVNKFNIELFNSSFNNIYIYIDDDFICNIIGFIKYLNRVILK